MPHDILIKDANLLDGLGLPGRLADIGIRDGRISAIGRVSERAGTTFDAGGLALAPGIVDIHTDYDPQLNWDPLATSSCWHGVTTVVAGNCGFGIAPVRPADHEYTTRMFARVEGLPWDWESFPE
jgi:N-acyl-D-aspartate/D-glutamate deacylase